MNVKMACCVIQKPLASFVIYQRQGQHSGLADKNCHGVSSLIFKFKNK